jgi:transcriptional regulator with XRE-family HTH domain
MSIADPTVVRWNVSQQGTLSTIGDQPLHRLKLVRRQQGLSRRNMALRLDVNIQTVRLQEHEMTDLSLSTLYAWREILQVPVANLLVDSDNLLMSPILERSQLLRCMKTVLAIRERAQQKAIVRMAQTLYDQLVMIMPELANVTPWHEFGKRRQRCEVGAIAQRHVSDDFFVDRGEWSME